MSKRGMHIMLSAAALILGSCLYILLRPTTYIGIFCSRFPAVAYLQAMARQWECDFLAYYFADYLWAFALFNGLLSIHMPHMTGAAGCALLTFCCGCLWEIMQRVNVVDGTGDCLDVLMYFLAIVTTMKIYKRERVYEKDN